MFQKVVPTPGAARPARSAAPRRLRLRLVTLISTVLLTAALPGPLHRALCQEIQKLDAAAQQQAIVSHLNNVIQFYRSINQPIQKAGEPNDVIYRDQAVGQSAEIARYAFDSAKAEAALLTATQGPGAAAGLQSGEQQRMQAAQNSVAQRISDLEGRIAAVEKQIATAKARDRVALEEQRRQLQQALDLANAMKTALTKITGMSGGAGASGLAGTVDRLQQDVPELQTNNKTAAPQITTIDSALSSGLTTQASVLFDLVAASHTVQNLLDQEQALHQQAIELRTPLTNILRALVQQGQQLTLAAEQAPAPAAAPARSSHHGAAAAPAKSSTPQGAAANAAPADASSSQAAAPATPAAPAPPTIASITAHFKALSAATVPLSQEIIILEQSRGNLSAWHAALTSEYHRVLNAILLRVLIIAIALAIIVGGGQLWTRAANKYIHDIRRRRQILIIRRVVVGFLSSLVLLFGFVTQFHSLATFAGFITAGIAVGLQTVLLSVAAYFFIIGRYGIKVGDRITISSVTGDVIDVGLVRFYLMELAGSGTELKPTGRVVVFSNAVLFQAGTPLYKQIPGTSHAWHELVIKLTDAADYKSICSAVLHAVETVYSDYRDKILREHETVENWMQTTLDKPGIESRLQFSNGAFQLWARFPVEIENAGRTDERITQALLQLMATNPTVKAAVTGTPTIQASVRG